MSRTHETVEERRTRTSPAIREVAGMLRRVAITVTSGPFWQVIGHLLIDGVTREGLQAEPFTGIGYSVRPKAGRNAEAIVANIGGAENPVIVATRDEDTRLAMAGSVGEDENAYYNSTCGMFIRNNTTVEIRTAAGVALKLPTMADYEALRTFVVAQFSGAGHAHGVSGASTNATTPVGTPPGAGTGTTVLKGQ